MRQVHQIIQILFCSGFGVERNLSGWSKRGRRGVALRQLSVETTAAPWLTGRPTIYHMSSQRDPWIDELDQVAGGKLGSISTAGTGLMPGSTGTGRAYQNTESGHPEASLKF